MSQAERQRLNGRPPVPPGGTLRAKLLENGQAQRAAIRNGSDDPQPLGPYPVVKLFTPDAGATWLLTELDPEDDALKTFGLCELDEPELAYVRISEMQTLRGPVRLPVERDRHFTASRPISAYFRDARRAGAQISVEAGRVAQYGRELLAAWPL